MQKPKPIIKNLLGQKKKAQKLEKEGENLLSIEDFLSLRE